MVVVKAHQLSKGPSKPPDGGGGVRHPRTDSVFTCLGESSQDCGGVWVDEMLATSTSVWI